MFFDLPIVGLVVYPQGLEFPLAILALALVIALVVPDRKGVVTGWLAALVAIVLSGGIAWAVGRMLSGPAFWSGLYATGIVLLALSVTTACYAVAKRWSTPRGLHVGALIVWLAIALELAIRVPGISYLFTWPLLFAASAALVTRGREVAEWATAVVAILMLVGFFYGGSVVMLGVAGFYSRHCSSPSPETRAGRARHGSRALKRCFLRSPLSLCIRAPTILCARHSCTLKMPTRATPGLVRWRARVIPGPARLSGRKRPDPVPSGRRICRTTRAGSLAEGSHAFRSQPPTHHWSATQRSTEPGASCSVSPRRLEPPGW